MKKLFISLTVLFVLVMSACSNGSTDKKNDAKGKKSETITYQSENGKVEVRQIHNVLLSYHHSVT